MAYTLYWWHPARGINHFVWDAPHQLSTHVKALEERELHMLNQPLSYYAYVSDTDLVQSGWWYYCKPPPLNPNDHLTATEVMLSHKDPWQRRSPEGVPKEIRAYHLLLG